MVIPIISWCFLTIKPILTNQEEFVLYHLAFAEEFELYDTQELPSYSIPEDMYQEQQKTSVKDAAHEHASLNLIPNNIAQVSQECST